MGWSPCLTTRRGYFCLTSDLHVMYWPWKYNDDTMMPMTDTLVLWTLWGWGKIKEWNQGTFWPMVYLVYLLIKNLSTYSLPVCMGRGSWPYFTQSALFIIFIRQPSTAQPGNDKAVSSQWLVITREVAGRRFQEVSGRMGGILFWHIH